MHYYAYEFAHSVLSPMRFGVSGVRSMLDWPFNPIANTPYGRHLAAACELFENVTRRYGKPEFGLKTTRVAGVEVGVREQVVASTPFGRSADSTNHCASAKTSTSCGGSAKPGFVAGTSPPRTSGSGAWSSRARPWGPGRRAWAPTR